MKTSCLLLLGVTFAFPVVLLAAGTELSDAQTWEQLKTASSTSITSVADNCQKSIDEARNSCKSSIDRTTQLVSKAKDKISAQKLIHETAEEVSGILQSVSSNVYGQLLEIGNRFQKRLEQIIEACNSIQPAIVEELKGIFQSPIDETDQIIINAKQLFSPSYNPSIKLKEGVTNDIGKLTTASEIELNQLQKTIIDTLNRFNKGITVAKDVQMAIKKSGQLPQPWKTQDLKKILLSCAQITLTLQAVGKMPDQNSQRTESSVQHEETQPRQQVKSVATSSVSRQSVNDEISILLEEEVELAEDDGESGCGQIFDRAKKKLRTKLVATVTDIKKATNAKKIDSCTYNALENYGDVLGDVSHKINAKIVDFSHQFIKLYATVLGIMEKINQGMRDRLVEIFNDQSTDATDFYYNNIRKYFAETYLTDAKMKELLASASNSMKTAKTRKELQKQIIKQLSSVTSDLVRDMDTMKSTTIYILLEMRKGVIALQNLKNKSNISGIRYWFNYYDGKTDCAQVKKLIHIVNAINIYGLFEREITALQSPDELLKFEAITQMIQKTLSDKMVTSVTELELKTSLREVESVRSKFLQSFNSIVTVYKLKVKKIMKKTVVKFINAYEETLIMLKRKYVKEAELLDAILDNETRNVDSEMPLFGIYLSRTEETNVEQDTGIRLGRKFKNVKEAKYTMKYNINQISQILNSHTTEMKTEIQKIMTIINEEAIRLQQLQRDIDGNKNYVINIDKFSKLAFLMQLANTLNISHGDVTNGANIDMNSSNQKLESYFESAIERLRSEKQNAQLEIEKCTDTKQLQAEVMMVSTRMREIISDTVLEMRTDINQYTTHYNTALDTYIKSTKHETILKVLERGKEDEAIQISLSEHLQNYLQDKYSNTILEMFLTSATKSNDFQHNMKSVQETLNLTIKQIETDMMSAKSESMDTIFKTLKQAIDTLEEVTESTEGKQRLDEEKMKTLNCVSRLLKILHDHTAIKAENSIDEAKNVISKARDSFNNEYKRSVKTLSSLTDKSSVQTEIKNAVSLFEGIYNTMRQQVKIKMESVSIEFYENFKVVNAKTSQTETIVQEIMCGVYNNEFIQKDEYQKFIAFVNSESYISSVAINSIYERMQRSQNMNVGNGQSLHILNNLKSEVISSINNFEKVIEFISHTFEESTNIISSINKGKQLEITDVHDISVLTQSLLIYQALLQIQNRADFASVQRIIIQEYEETVQTITSTVDENIVKEAVLKSIEKYDTVGNIIENEVTQKFMKITSDFTNKYEIVMQVVTAGGREELLVVLQNIIEKKMCDTISERYRKFETYINSSGFRSTTFAKDSYQRILQQQEASTTSIKNISLEQLKVLTSAMEEYIQELDTESQFANEHFLKGTRILQSIQSGNFKLTEEQIQIITECVMISQMIFRQNNFNNVQSKKDEEWAAVSIAKKSVDEEYSHTIETINSIKERVIIEQTISTTIYKYDDIYNNLREEMKQTFSTLQIDFTTTYDTITEILQIQNIPMFNKLQTIQNKPTNISVKYTKFESYIKSEIFTSYSLIKNEFFKIKQDNKSANANKIEHHIEQLTSITKMVEQQIEKIDQIQRYVAQVLYKSTEILQSTETDVNMQLNEEQFITLCEAFKISKIIEAVILSEEQLEEKFLTAERNINDIYENTINEIQVSNHESIQETISLNIQNYTAIYNNLREEVKEIFSHKSTFFISTFNTVSKSILLQQTETSTIFEDITKRKSNTQFFSPEYQEFTNYITSDKFASSSYITHIYQNQNIEVWSTRTNMKETHVQLLTAITTEVKERISEMNKIRQLVLRYMQENTEYLRTFESNLNAKVTQEQITKLVECINISETVTFTCVKVSSEREIFETTETTINKEYEKTFRSILEAKQEEEMKQVIDNTVQYYEESYNTLKKDVKEILIQTSTEFTHSYTKVLQNLRLQKKTKLIKFFESIQFTKKTTTVIESHTKCELYFNSESFKSNIWLLKYYDETVKQGSNNKITKENCIKELKTLTSEVNYQVVQAKYTSKYIMQLFEQSAEVFKLIESDNCDQQLTDEQIYLLTESMIISEQVSCKFSNKSQQEAILYTTTQRDIWNIYQNALHDIQNSKDTKVEEILSRSVQSYNEVYNGYRSELRKDFTKTTNEFSDVFNTIIKNVEKENINSVLGTTLKNIKCKRIKVAVSEEYTKFEAYITREKFVSTNIVNTLYNELKRAQPITNITHQGLSHMKALTKEVEVLTTELNNACQFVSETIQKSINSLKVIEMNTNIELTQEQITILTESTLITEVLTEQCSSIHQEGEKIFTVAETRIEEEKNKVTSIIKSTENKDAIQSTITSAIKNYDQIYNEARQEVKQVFIKLTTEFTKTYETMIETFKIQENRKHIGSLLQNIQLKGMTANISEEYRRFESYINSEAFTSALIATHSYQNTVQQKMSTRNLSEDNFKHIDTVTADIQKYLNEMNTIQQYVSHTLYKSTNILKSLEQNNIQELTQEEITTLTESLTTVQTVSIELNPKSTQKEELFATAEINVDKQYENALQSIQSTTDEESVRQVMLESIETYDATVSTLNQEIQNMFTEATTDFTNVFEEVLNTNFSHTQKNSQLGTILQNIKEHKLEVQLSEDYQIFEKFIKSETFSSSNSISLIYNKVQSEEIDAERERSINDRSINQLKNVTTKVNQYIVQTKTVTKYVTRVFQKSTKILKLIEKGENIELTVEQKNILSESITISEKLSSNHSTIENISEAETRIHEEYQNTLQKIKSTTNEKEIHQVLTTVINHYDSIYQNISNKVQSNIQHAEKGYLNKVESTLTSIEEKNHSKEALQKILYGEIKSVTKSDQDFQLFESYINQDTFTSSDSMQKLYENIKHCEESKYRSNNITASQHAIEKLTTITDQLHKQMSGIKFVENYVSTNYKRSSDILEKVSKHQEVNELTEEEIHTLTITTKITQTLQCLETTKNQQTTRSTAKQHNVSSIETQDIFINIQKVVSEERKATIELIKSTENDEKVKEVTEKHIETLYKTYSEARETTNTCIAHTTNNFVSRLQSTVNLIENVEIQSTLNEVMNGSINLNYSEQDEEFKKFASCITSETFSSQETMKSNIEETESSISIKERSIQKIDSVSQKISDNLRVMEETSKFISENLQKSDSILKKVEEEKEIHLTEEEVRQIVRSVKITKVIQKTEIVKLYDTTNTTLQNPSSETTNDQQTTRSVAEQYKLSEIETQNTLINVQNVVREERKAAIELIKSIENEEKVNEITEKHLETLDKTYSNAQETTKTYVAQTTTNFVNHLQSTINRIENVEIQSTLKEVMNKSTNLNDCQEDEEFKKFVSCISSETFSSQHTIKTSIEESESNLTVKEKSIQKIDSMSQKISENLRIMEETSKFISENCQKSDNILKKVEEGKEIHLTEEEIEQIIRSVKITEVIQKTEIVKSEETTNVNLRNQSLETTKDQHSTRSVADQYMLTDIETQHSLVNAKKVVSEEREATIKLIKSTENEEKVKEVTEKHIETLGKTYSNAQETTKTYIAHTTNNFVNHFHSSVNQIENVEIKNTLNEVMNETSNFEDSEEDEEFKKFVSCISSETFSSQHTVNLNIEETESSLSIREGSIQKIDSVSQKIRENLQTMEETSKFISENLQKSDNILKKVKEEKEVHLSEEEVKQIVRSVKITKVMQQTNFVKLEDTTNAVGRNECLKTEEQQNTRSVAVKHELSEIEMQDTLINVQKVVSEEKEATIELIRSIENEEKVKEVVEKEMESLDKTYSNAQETTKTYIAHTTNNFVNHFQSTVNQIENVEIQNTLNEVMNKNYILENSEDDEEFKKFVSSMSSETFSSQHTIKTSIKETESSPSIKEGGIQKIDSVSKKISENVRVMEETSKFISENLKKGDDILKKVEEEKEVHFSEEEVKQIIRSVKITKIIQQTEMVKLEETKDAAARHESSDTTKNQQSTRSVTVEDHKVNEIEVNDSLINIQKVVEEEKEATIELIKSTDDEEKLKEVVEKEIESLDKTYSEARETTKIYIAHTTDNFVNHLQSTVNQIENVEIQNALNEVMNQSPNLDDSEEDEEFRKFASSICGDTFSSQHTIKTNIEETESSLSIKEKSIQKIDSVSQKISENVKAMEETSKFISENIQKSDNILKKVEEQKEVNISEEEVKQIVRSVKITKIIQQTEIVKLERAMVAKNQSSETTKNQHSTKSVAEQHKPTEVETQDTLINAQKVVNEEREATIKLIKSTENEEKLKEVTEKHIETLSKTYSSAQETTKTYIAHNTNNFVNHFQLTVNQIKNVEIQNTLNEAVNKNTNFEDSEEDEEFKKFVSCISSETFSPQQTVNLNIEETESSLSIKEGSIQKIDSVSQKMGENLLTMEETSKFISENLQKSDNILKKVEEEEEIQLSEEEVKQVVRSVKITKILQHYNVIQSDNTLSNETLHVDRGRKDVNVDNKSTIKFQEKESEIVKSNAEKQITVKGKIEHIKSPRSDESKTYQSPSQIEELNSAMIEEDKPEKEGTMFKREFEQSRTAATKFESHQTSTKTEMQKSKSETPTKEVLPSTVKNECSKLDFTAVQQTLEEESYATIDSIKTTEDDEKVEEIVKEHIQTLDNTYETIRQNTEKEITETSNNFVNTFQSTLSQTHNTDVRNTLNEIINQNEQCSTEKDEELKKFESHLKSHAFSSQCTATNLYQEVDKELGNTTDVKEKCIHEVEAVGAKLNENLHAMEETKTFVAENLQKSSDTLKKVEANKESKLNDEEVKQITRSMTITKVLHESEITHSDTKYKGRSLDATHDEDAAIIAAESTHTHTSHTETRGEKHQHNVQRTITTDKTEKDVSLTNLKNLPDNNNCLSVQPQNCYEGKSKVLDKVSSSKLLASWKVTESEDKRWPSECRNLSWCSEKFTDSIENKVFVDEISQILKISRNLIENTISMELKKLKLNRRVRDDLSALTVCVDNVYNILQRLSTYVFEEMERFSDALEKQIKSCRHVEKKLASVSVTLDDEFVAVSKTFFDLQYSKNSDILDLIDNQYENEICDTIAKSRKVSKEKLDKLQSTTNTILDNIDCLVLTMLDTFVNGKVAFQDLAAKGKGVSLESLKNSQKLFELLADGSS